jgi:hypothetical protein
MNKKYTGITYKRGICKYESKVTHIGVTYFCGFFDSELEAIKARDLCILRNGLKVKLQFLKPAK